MIRFFHTTLTVLANQVKKQLKPKSKPSKPSKPNVGPTKQQISDRRKEKKERRYREIIQKGVDKMPSRFRLADPSLLMQENTKDLDELSKSFDELDLLPKTRKVLQWMNIDSPTFIQQLAIPRLLSRRSAVIMAETGCGKTFSYLLPLFKNIHIDLYENKNLCVKQFPRAIILVPSRELAIQVSRVSQVLGRATGFNSTCLVERFGKKNLFAEPVDIVVTIPTRLAELVSHKIVSLDHVRYLIIDEADTLLDPKFAGDTLNLIDLMKKDEKKIIKLEQIVIVTATVTKAVNRIIKEYFGEFQIISTKNLHRPSDKVSQRFIEVQNPGNAKKEISLKMVDKYQKEYFMIFCNSKDSCNALYEYFIAHKFKGAAVLHAGIDVLVTKTKRFLTKTRQKVLDQFRKKEIRALICTDLASRGIDVPHINHVLIYDFPRNTINYLHRIGRAGRAGVKGRSSSLVTRKDRAMFKFIQLAVFQKKALSDLA